MTRAPAFLLAALASTGLACLALADEAIPFDAKKAQALADRERAYVEATSRTAYKAVGRRSPKWDADADMAFRANLDRACGPVWGRSVAEDKLRAAAQAAVEAGCDDPLVRFLQARWRIRPADGEDDEDLREMNYLLAARGLAGSKYPPGWAAHAYLSAIEAIQTGPNAGRPAEVKQVEACRTEALKALAAAVKGKDPIERRDLAELCHWVHLEGARTGKRKEWYDRLEAEVLAGLPKDDPLPRLCAGVFLVDYAWDARGGGVAATVTREGWRLFGDRLAEAERRLTAAWDLDHECAAAASHMVSVCMGLSRDRETMEKWFGRAVAADPVRTDAFDRKMMYLQPRWGGSVEDILAFGRQVTKLGRWDTVLPRITLQAYAAAALGSGEGIEYFRRDDVWAEVEPILEGVRKGYPKSPSAASFYLYYARMYDRNGTQAHAYVKGQELPLTQAPFPSPLALESALEWAEAAAKEAKEKK